MRTPNLFDQINKRFPKWFTTKKERAFNYIMNMPLDAERPKQRKLVDVDGEMMDLGWTA